MRHTALPRSECMMSNILRDQSGHIGNDTWLLTDDRRYTFAEADALVDGYARGLRAVGVRRHDNVAIFMENSAEFLWIALAIVRLGARFVPLNTAFKGQYLRHGLQQSAASTVIVDGDLAGRVRELHGELDALERVIVHGRPSDPDGGCLTLGDVFLDHGSSIAQEGVASDPATILYTSGTTGRSKGALLSHLYWYDATTSSNPLRDIRDDDVFYVASPMFHAASWVIQIYNSLTLGLPVAIDQKFSLRHFWDRVRHYGATQILTMASTHLWLYNAPPREDDRDNPARVWAPIPLAPELCAPFQQRFGIEHLWFCYGQTEALMATSTAAGRPYTPGSAGWARPGLELLIVDDHDNLLPAGAVGELAIRARVPHTIMDGYWQQPEATATAFRNDLYHTGDLARLSPDGELFFVDRKADYLRFGGENISSFELESSVNEHPAVAEVAAFMTAMQPDTSQEEVMICVVPASGTELNPRELAEFCSATLPRFAVPRFIEIVEDLPRTPTNRVQKFALRQRGPSTATWDRIASGMKVPR